MKTTVLGTGQVGRALAHRLDELGHDVTIGTRDVASTMARSADEATSFAAWHADHPEVALLPFADASAGAEVVLNATNGVNALRALELTGADHLDGVVLIDLAIPLDFSHGMPPALTIANTDSLGELVQRTFPRARVVKTLNTVYKDVMVDPARVPGKHNLFLAGDDADAKAVAAGLLQQFGWPADSLIDLGGIHSARATEMYMQLYFLLVGQFGFDLNISVVRS